jgi:hypothetical protein
MIRQWVKSSRSQANGDCVEVATTLDEVRDSKNPHGPTLRLEPGAFTAFVRAVKSGQFDR